MAEALVAVSLAASILQFIDVGSRFVSNVWKIYISGKERTSELPDIRETTEDLHNVLEGLKNSQGAVLGVREDERGLQQLVQSCQTLATELLGTLQKINLPDKIRKRDALMAAFRMVWKEEEIKSLQSRLEEFRQEVALHLLSLIR